MPIYRYHCYECDINFELTQNMEHRNPPAYCPRCGASDGEGIRRRPFPQVAIIKDYGFYRSKHKEDKKRG